MGKTWRTKHGRHCSRINTPAAAMEVEWCWYELPGGCTVRVAAGGTDSDAMLLRMMCFGGVVVTQCSTFGVQTLS